MTKVSLIAALLLFGQSSYSQTAEVVTASELQQRITNGSEDIQIVNFWATWCGPCIKELPFLERITTEGRPNVKVLLVSLDLDLDPDRDKVYKFIARKNIQSEVLLLDEPDPNSWINKIEPEWSGALPATVIINQKTGKRKFIGHALREGELERYLDEIQ